MPAIPFHDMNKPFVCWFGGEPHDWQECAKYHPEATYSDPQEAVNAEEDEARCERTEAQGQ